MKVPMEGGQGLRKDGHYVVLVVADSQELNLVRLEAFPSEVHPQSARTHKCNKLGTIQGSNLSKQPFKIH